MMGVELKSHWYDKEICHSGYGERVCAADEAEFISWLREDSQFGAFPVSPGGEYPPYFVGTQRAVINRQFR